MALSIKELGEVLAEINTLESAALASCRRLFAQDPALQEAIDSALYDTERGIIGLRIAAYADAGILLNIGFDA